MAPEAIADCTLLDLFEHTAFNTPGKGLLIYDRGPMEKGPIILSYNNLKSIADGRGKQLLPYVNLEENPVILLHVNNHQDGLVWFWAILAAGGIPCISTPLSKHVEQRQKHLESLQKLLDNPLVLTTNVLAPEFAGVKNIHIKTIDEIVTTPSQGGTVLGGYKKHRSDLAVLMLTSGSTGNSKAVAFTHKQIIHALGVKASHHKTTPDTVFLNWTGLDHVANLIEIHLHALAFGAAQVHVPSSTILADPMVFLELISKHRVSYTFAPNFFLAVLVQKFLSPEYSTALREKGNRFRPRALPGRDSNLDLSCLRSLISGGESNVVQTCRALTVLLRIFRAPETFIRPGFGMTETCAGCIYNSVDCPEYDLSLNSEFACLGDCVAGISFRITRADGSEAARNEIGEMQVKGDVVFEKYYNDQESTEKSFTKDGWFRTGDRGFRDSKGRLHLTGRDKDTVVINGASYHPLAIESAIEAANIPGLTPSFTVAFAHRPKGSDTEAVVIVYLPSYDVSDPAPRVHTAASISKVVITHCGARPYKILPLDNALLQRSSLGKLARPKIREAFEEGEYKSQIKHDETVIACYKDEAFEPTTTLTELAIIDACNTILNTTSGQIGINNDIFKLGLSSIDLLKVRLSLQTTLAITDIPLALFFSHPQIRNLALALADLQTRHSSYDPIVTLQSHGTKTPLFLIHPGVGEILVFMNLSRHFADRPIYAIRARGFDGEPYFTSFPELVSTYHSAIKRIQPTGPYALLGYSYGSIAAFEITKVIEAAGDEVKMLAILDQAPFFKERARSYDWYEVVMTISFFVGLIPEEFAYAVIPTMRLLSHKQVLNIIFALAPPSRIAEVDMTREKLDNWAKLAFELKKIVWDYEPEGKVSKMDVFYTGPLIGLVKAKTTEEWFRHFISKWGRFVEDVGWYEVGGMHRSMISPPHLAGFVRKLKMVMEMRGL